MRHKPSDRYFCDVHDDGLLFTRYGRITKPDYWMEENHTDFDFEAHAAAQHAATTTTTEAAADINDRGHRWTHYERNENVGVWIAAVAYDDAPHPPYLYINCRNNNIIEAIINTPYPLNNSDEPEAVVEWWPTSKPTDYNAELWFTSREPESTVQPAPSSPFLDQITSGQTTTLTVVFTSVDDYDPEADNPAGIYSATFDITGADRHYETITQNCL